MPKVIINSIFIVLFFCFKPCYPQQKTTTFNEIRNLNQSSDDYFHEANFEQSLITSKKALRLATLNNYDDLAAVAYNRIARNFDELSESEKALSFFQKGLVYAEKGKNLHTVNMIINNIGNSYYFTLKNHDKGIEYFKKSDSLSRVIPSKSGIIIANLNLAWAYFDVKQFDKGLPHLDYINKYNKLFGEQGSDVSICMLNGMYFSYLNQNKKADSCFIKGLEISKKYVLKDDKDDLYKAYSEFLFKTGSYKKAYENLENYNKITLEFYNEAKIKKANISGINIEIDEYKKEIDIIASEKEKSISNLKKSKTINYLVLIVLGIVILLLYSLYKNYRLKKKSNSRLLEINEELVQAIHKADEASYLKSQFVSTITHELRTPLYGVVGMTNIILDENEDLKNNNHLKSLKFSANYLLSLVNDLLQINKIEEKKIVLEFTTINLSDEIKTITESLEFIAEKNNNKLITNIDSTIPKLVIADKLRLSQIFINLISNALKFTNNGYVKISAKLEKIEINNCFINFEIEDNGVGIPIEDQDKIFEKFYQVDRRESDYQGTGLGLSIVQKLLELFDSKITLKSKENKGATFTFTIGFETQQQPTILDDITLDSLDNTNKYNILVVEDNKINQIVTKKILEKNKFRCTIVDDGYAAIQILETNKFDLILMDINMPMINGYETTRIIRNKQNTIPIVALTAFDKEEIKEKIIECGMNDVIIKPFESQKLFEILEKLFHKKNVD